MKKRNIKTSENDLNLSNNPANDDTESIHSKESNIKENFNLCLKTNDNRSEIKSYNILGEEIDDSGWLCL